MIILPPLSWSATLRYRDIYALYFVANTAIFWLIFGTISVITGYLALRLRSKKEIQESSIADDYYSSKTSPMIKLQGRYNNKEATGRTYSGDFYESYNDQKNKILRYVESLFSWLSYIAFATIPVWLSAFNLIPLWAGITIAFIVLFVRFHLSLYRNCPISPIKHRSGYKEYKKVLSTMLQLYPRRVLAAFIMIILISTLLNLSTYKSCMNDHSEHAYGVPLEGGDYIYSSAFTRLVSIPKVCPAGPPCHVYATLPFDTSSSVYINVHTHNDVKNITISYATEQELLLPNGISQQAFTTYLVSPAYDYKGERNIHNVLLTGLTPDSEYTIEISYSGATQYTIKYTTLPSEESTDPYTLIYGGDLGVSPTATTMATLIAKRNPRAIMIGGDLAYDNGETSCYYTMDLFLQSIEQQIYTSVGRLVPLILGVGNHDIGYQSLANVGRPSITKDGPSFYTHYPQNMPVDKTGNLLQRVPELEERYTYHAHLIGNILNVVLDSGYMANYDGAQLAWLENMVSTYQNYSKIAIYHDPIMSPCNYNNETAENIADGLLNWTPIFDKYNFMAAFENHKHAYKRTFPLRGLNYAEDGTVYFGDGAWGVKTQSCVQDNSTGIFANYGPYNHIWEVQIDPSNSQITYTPLGIDDVYIDVPTVQNLTLYAESNRVFSQDL